MGKKVQVSEKKLAYYARITQLIQNHQRGFVVCCDHVGSNQLQQIRSAVRKSATIVFGKNTLIRKAIRALMPEMPHLEKLLPCFKYNVGFVFTQSDLKVVRDQLLANQVPAAARPGQNAQCDVIIEAQNTGLDPGQTAFFQALSIPTRISKGTIEIMNDVKLITAGEKVGSSECALLQKLNIKPFSFGLEVRYCFDNGVVFEPTVLDIDRTAVVKMLKSAVSDFAAIGLATGVPNGASIRHTFAKTFKSLVGLGVGSEGYSNDLIDSVKAGAAAAASAAPAARATTAAPKETAVVAAPEVEEEFGFSLFD